MTQEEKVALLKKAGVWDVIGFPSCIDKLFDLVAAHEREKQAEQEPVPTGATHYQPHQKTYYKRVSATEWYLWSCTGKGWLPSKGTSDSSEWIMLSPIQAHQPAKPAEQDPVAIAIVTKTKTDANYITNIDLSIAEAGYKLPSGEHSLYAAPVSIAKQSETDSSSSSMRTTVRTKDPCNPLQDLTDDEIEELMNREFPQNDWLWHYTRAVIAADREKNK